MKKKSLIAVALAAIVALAAVLVHRAAFAKETTEYRFATIRKGDVEATVAATGTLSSVRTVQVGTQVSGQIAELFVDFNDTVKKGQLLARIDPTLQQQACTESSNALDGPIASGLLRWGFASPSSSSASGDVSCDQVCPSPHLHPHPQFRSRALSTKSMPRSSTSSAARNSPHKCDSITPQSETQEG